LRATDKTEYWRDRSNVPKLETILTRLQHKDAKQETEERPEWIIVPRAQDFNTPRKSDLLKEAIQQGKQRGGKAAVLL
jgi:hypothetical protein